MARKTSTSETPALQWLRREGVGFVIHVYEYIDHGGTRVSAESLGVDEHHVIKTLVMEDEHRAPLIVLMNGDHSVSTKALARQIDRKRIEPCRPEVAQRHTGYQVGGTSPFGIRKRIPVYIERNIVEIERIYINGGRRGLLVEIDGRQLATLTDGTLVNVAGIG